MRRTEIRRLMLEERRDLRQFLDTLTPEQWDSPSLCGEWTVRELVAHLVAWDDLLLYRSRREHVRAFARFMWLYTVSLGSMNRLNQRLQQGAGPVERFGLDDGADLKWVFDGANPGAHFAEYVIHQQDIRRPLGLPREIPPDRLLAALDGLMKLPGVRGPAMRRLRSTTWQASDADWRKGHGPLVEAPGEEILMILAGRG